MDGKRKKAYSYLRFSAPEQAKGDSFRRQATLAADYAQRNDLDLDETLTFQDLGVSAYRGVNAETGQLGALVDAVQTGLVPAGSIILVESLDRISRQSARKALRLIETIVEAGVSVVTLTDEREYTAANLDNDPLNLLMALLTFIRANEESQTKSRRVAEAWVAKRARALERPLTARCPSWVRLSEDRKSLELVPEQAATVRLIFDYAAAGRGGLWICRRLNEDKVPLLTAGSKLGEMWYAANISRLLNNPAIAGVLIPYRQEHLHGRIRRREQPAVEGYYPPVVSVGEFESLRDRRRDDRLGRQGAMPAYNIIGRLSSCVFCGRSMVLVSKSDRGHYLICKTAYSAAGCRFRSIRYSEVEYTIINRLARAIPHGLFPQHGVYARRLAEFQALVSAGTLDRQALNLALRNLAEEAWLDPDRGTMRFDWKGGGSSELLEAFTPATERERLLKRKG